MSTDQVKAYYGYALGSLCHCNLRGGALSISKQDRPMFGVSNSIHFDGNCHFRAIDPGQTDIISGYIPKMNFSAEDAHYLSPSFLPDFDQSAMEQAAAEEQRKVKAKLSSQANFTMSGKEWRHRAGHHQTQQWRAIFQKEVNDQSTISTEGSGEVVKRVKGAGCVGLPKNQVVVAFGAAKFGHSGRKEGLRAPIEKFKNHLRRHVTLCLIDEFRTSKVCSNWDHYQNDTKNDPDEKSIASVLESSLDDSEPEEDVAIDLLTEEDFVVTDKQKEW
ncbi:hypothetical protein DFS34DRAFT_591796 [Phlyctochytrium arcticum]|nr:hypothetical protein DFS34DRAFT_591796 [Phlyctochytrium arcticum]